MSLNPYLPAEWAPQSAVLLTWPHSDGHWGRHFAEVESNFLELAKSIARFEKVVISFRDQSTADGALDRLRSANTDMTRINSYLAASNDVWARDHGPITVIKDHAAQLLDFRFNGWGGKYPADADNLITRSLHRQNAFGPCPLLAVDLVLEGGAIETDGEGVMLTTGDCLPRSSRNPGVSLEEFESLFKEYFGIHSVHWLSHGHLAGDDTDGHIDTIARFANPRTIVYQGCTDPQDEHFAELAALGDELGKLRQPNGEPYKLHALPLPGPVYDDAGQRLPASYANFLIINDAVLMPGYHDAADKLAARILAECFPDREIITLDCRPLIHQYGSLHCVTMQLPAQLEIPEA